MLFDYPRSRRQQEIFATLYLILYSIFLAYDYLGTTMFSIPWHDATPWIMFALAILVVGIKILLIDRHTPTEIYLSIFLTISFFGTIINTGSLVLIFPLLLILGAKHVSFTRIVQIYCIIAGTLIVVTISASQLGIVENLIYGNRVSFGFIYPTDFTAHIFFLVMGYCYLRRNRLTYAELFAILALSIFSMVFCRARTNSLCLLLAFAIFLYLKVRTEMSITNGTEYEMNTCLSKALVISMPVCAALILGLTFLYNYDPGLPLMRTIDKFLTGRLYWGSLGLEQYGIRLFGSTFDMIGAGGTTSVKKDYFVLDSSYVLLLIRYGIMVFLSVITYYVLSAKRAFTEKNIILLWILVLISIQCIMEHHLLEIAYNPFLYFLFSSNHQIDN